ncbi:right-handed parallel beta-helix repeat-containing protein [Candidatus Bipolaricaulota bacterium]|nr:right-handed parallel beta-helix repeat-containing protein [Candidatus Bipolaricaulota bacterium]
MRKTTERRKRRTMLPALCLVFISVGILHGTAVAQILQIPEGTSIQDAIDRAPPGAVLQLLAGTFSESLTISKSLTLRSDPANPDRTIIEAASPEGAVVITGTASPEVVLEGLTVRGAYGYVPDGIVVYAPARVLLRSVHIADCEGSGVAVYSEGHVTLENCSLSGNGAYGVVATDAAGLVDGAGNVFRDNAVDVGGYADPKIRIPLVAETDALVVRVPSDTESLQQAIDAVAPHGTVLIEPGSYHQGLCLWKPVTLRGTGEGVELGAAGNAKLGGAVLASSRSVSLENLVLQSGWEIVTDDLLLRDLDVHAVDGDAFAIAQADSVLVVGSTFHDVRGTALAVTGQAEVRLKDCSFVGSWYGLRVDGSASVEIVNTSFYDHDAQSLILSDAARASLEACVLRDNAAGLSLQGSADVTLETCAFENTRGTCLKLADDAVARVEACTFASSGGDAIVCSDRSSLSLTSSFVREGGGSGLVLKAWAQATALSCKFANNAENGVRVEGAANVFLSHCHITRNGTKSDEDPLSLIGQSGAQAGLLMIDSSTAHLERVTVSDNAGTGICITPIELAFGGILPSYASALLEDCTLAGNGRDGIYAWTNTGIEMDRCTITQNAGCGLNIEARGQHRLSESVIEGNQGIGLAVSSASVVAYSVDVDANTIGIMLYEDAKLSLTNCRILRNWLGVLTYCETCTEEFEIPFNRDYLFTGLLSGSGNTIPDSDEPDANPLGRVCPDDGSIDVSALISEMTDEEPGVPDSPN